MRIRLLVLLLSFGLLVSPFTSSAAAFGNQLLLPLSRVAAEHAINIWAVNGLQKTVNGLNKSLELKGLNPRVIKFAFGASVGLHLAALAAFAAYSHYNPVDNTICNQTGLSKTASKAQLSVTYASPYWSIRYFNDTPSYFDYDLLHAGSRVTGGRIGSCFGSIQSAQDVMWIDQSTDTTQASADKLAADLKGFAVSNPTDFAAIAELSNLPKTLAPSNFAGVAGSVEVRSDGGVYLDGTYKNQATWTDSAGVSHTGTIDASGNLLVDGKPQTGFTATNINHPIGTNPNPLPPSGSSNSTSSDMGVVVDAINASKAQSVTNSQVIVDGLNSGFSNIQTNCDKFPNSAGCQQLGTLNTTPHDFGNGITSADTFASVYTKHSAVWSSSPLGSSITRLFPSTGIAGYPSWTIDLMGTTLVLDFAKYASIFSSLGALVVVLAGFQSIKIILGRD